MVLHIFYIPTSYAALIYGLLAGTGLLLTLFVATSKHSKEILSNACGEDHYEFWPSISASVGDMMPERQLWRYSFVLCVPFRLATAISLMFVFWQRSCNGMADIYAARNSGNWKQLLTSNACLTLVMLWSDLWRLIGTVTWTMVSSSESLAYHNLGFCPYVFLCFVLQVVTTILVRRSRYNLRIYPTQRDGERSYKLKKICVWGEGVTSVGVVVFFLRHAATCAPGSFSLSTICEWAFATFNIAFDATAWYDLKLDGWWLSTSPSFYRDLFRRARLGGGGGGADATPSARAGVAAVAVGPAHGDAADAATDAFLDDSGSVPAPTDTTGEYFLTKDIILHRLSFCSAPSRLTMWLCDIYWTHLFMESMVHLVEHMYFMPLIAMSLSWEISSVMVFGAPCLLRIGAFRRWATGPCFGAKTWLAPANVPRGLGYRVAPMYIAFYLCGALSHFHIQIQHHAGGKILAVAAGAFFFSLAFFTRFLYPSCATRKKGWVESNEESRRLLYSFPLGLALCMLLRILYVSQSPFYVEPFYAGLFGVVLGIAFTTIIYRHAMFGDAVLETTAQETGTATKAAASGAATPARGHPNDATEAVEMKDVDSDAPSASRDGGGASSSHPATAPAKVTQSQMEELAPNTIAALAAAYPRVKPALLGTLFGTTIAVIINIFIAPNYIPRLIAIDPFPASLVITGCYVCGVIFSADVLPICPSILRTRPGHSRGVAGVLGHIFGGSVKRFAMIMMAGVLILTHATRQTNFTVEKHGPHYPASYTMKREDVTIDDWDVQKTFWGSKHLAFAGGLVVVFCFGALLPVICELCLCHQRARRFAAVAESYDAEGFYRKECSYFTSFELYTLLFTIVPSVLFALVISYPFVPMAWLVRERSRSVIFLTFALLLGIVILLLGRVRKVSSNIVSDFFTARKQRTVQFMMRLIIVVAFLTVFIGRVSMQAGNLGFPAGKTTALTYPREVLKLHEMLVSLRVQRNGMTDPEMKKFETEFYKLRFEDALEEIGKNITEAKEAADVDPKYGLAHIASKDDRVDIWDAAKAMTFFSGMIWTVHFGLDNFDVDSFSRMAMHAAKTEAGVVGLLESDSMHLTNGNRDMVEYMSYYLGFPYTDYGPTALDNTYGCALISRYPIRKVYRYVAPSPLGELSCVIHAELDVFGLVIHTYVGHFGNTEHWVDGLLQSQFLGKLAKENMGASMWLGYLVTYPGNEERYHRYTDPIAPGLFRDAGLEMYTKHPWVRLIERGGFEEEPPITVTASPGESVDFNVEFKIPRAAHLEVSIPYPDRSFRRPPADKPNRYFYYNDTNRYTVAHPRFEFLDRYCQYSLYKTGRIEDELPGAQPLATSPFVAELFDWWRIVDDGVENMSDTEIQVIQLRFAPRA